MQIRLVPIVLFAATSLLTLKAFDMLLSGEALLEGPKAAQAAEGEKKESAKADDVKSGEKKEGEAMAAPVRPTEHIVPAKAEASAETTLNEKLGEKRRELDTRTKELEMRESLVQAAEKKLDDKTADTTATQAKTAQAGGSEDDKASAQIKNLVVMYETMKPKEAAAIFNSLDMGVMIEVVQHMKPQITALILAKMSTPAAQKLTVEIAKRSMMMQSGFAASAPADAPPGKTGPKELPRIDNLQKK